MQNLIPHLIYLLFLLSACGFKPIYGNKSTSDNNALELIEIEPIESIAGTKFYQHLSDILPRSHSAKYLLKVQFGYGSVPLAIQKNSDVLRQTVSQQVTYQLLDKETNKELTHGQFKNTSSYSTTFSPYATYVESEITLENLSQYAAEEVRTRLILYFANRKI